MRFGRTRTTGLEETMLSCRVWHCWEEAELLFIFEQNGSKLVQCDHQSKEVRWSGRLSTSRAKSNA
jgi:hypothetical protein